LGLHQDLTIFHRRPRPVAMIPSGSTVGKRADGAQADAVIGSG